MDARGWPAVFERERSEAPHAGALALGVSSRIAWSRLRVCALITLQALLCWATKQSHSAPLRRWCRSRRLRPPSSRGKMKKGGDEERKTDGARWRPETMVALDDKKRRMYENQRGPSTRPQRE